MKKLAKGATFDPQKLSEVLIPCLEYCHGAAEFQRVQEHRRHPGGERSLLRAGPCGEGQLLLGFVLRLL